MDDAEVLPVPEASVDEQAAAKTAAETVVAAFAQPGLSPTEWMDRMSPLLSPTGYEAYVSTDPAQIPVTRRTGDGAVLPASTDVLLIVAVPTDAGLYNVTLTRVGGTGPWLAERIRPAQG